MAGFKENDAYFTASPAARAVPAVKSSGWSDKRLAHKAKRPFRSAGWPFQWLRFFRRPDYLKEAMALASSSKMSKTV